MDTSSPRPICFVIMPFGTKPDPGGGPDIDFDRVYDEGIAPAIDKAGLKPVRADQEELGGIIHKPMYERLLLSDFVVVDMTTGNPNVFYEMGVRHATRPYTTLPIFSGGARIPFDVAMVKALRYELGVGNTFPAPKAKALVDSLERRLGELVALARDQEAADSPLFQLVADYRGPDLDRLRPDAFRHQIDWLSGFRERVKTLGRRALDGDTKARDGLADARDELKGEHAFERGAFLALLLAWRSIDEWSEMLDLIDAMPPGLEQSAFVREQKAFALNRSAKAAAHPIEVRRRALDVLKDLVATHGPSSETLGLMGRVHKDMWREATDAGRDVEATGYLRGAIECYRQGFRADLRDYYPGINLLTLLYVAGDPASLAEFARTMPVVRYAAEQRVGSTPDYWDQATLIELAVLGGDPVEANRRLALAAIEVRERFQAHTTADNLALIREARAARGEDVSWLDALIGELRGLRPRDEA